ncbi:DUF4374 domain-containing protein [Pontibacter diazotrophicus]|uniref:DUF4374 domain-containing protein n=1 Tax=Pontibacter diazotrophicus TaxID=1400979 RepID=A0A3D8LBC1_9BACT|nr:DUF4374 domain-containing protein [Pontibacter diazotrophicus]RDV14252.1 DUF4374 domain-containing protein [Pontibacter diazotrophicus]
MKNSLKLSAASLGLLLCMTACDSEVETATPQSGTNYIIGVQSQGSESDFSDYLLAEDDLMSGEIDPTGRGVEQTGWRYMTAVGNTFLSIGYFDDNQTIGYQLNEQGELVEKGRFVFETTLDLFQGVTENTALAVEVPRAGFADRVFHRIDVENLAIQAKIPSRIYENREDSLVAWPTSLVVRDNKAFVSFYTLHARGDFSTPSTDTAYVAVYSYPDMTFEKYMKDTRLGPLGIYGNANGLIKTESGDMYGYSAASYASGFTTQQKNSGIIRIKAGQTEFDDTYFFDFEEATGGNKLAFFHYIGNGKAIGRMIVDDAGLWGVYNIENPITKLVIIDLEGKAVTEVANIPLHGGQYSTPVLVDNGKVYVNVTTPTDAHIYEIDPVTATGTQGAQVKAIEAKAIFKAN